MLTAPAARDLFRAHTTSTTDRLRGGLPCEATRRPKDAGAKFRSSEDLGRPLSRVVRLEPKR